MTHHDESSYCWPEQSLRKFGEGAMFADGLPGGRMPWRGYAFVTGTGCTDRGKAGAADVWEAGAATTRTTGSTVSPAMARDMASWGNGRPKRGAPVAVPFLRKIFRVVTNWSYRTTQSVY